MKSTSTRKQLQYINTQSAQITREKKKTINRTLGRFIGVMINFYPFAKYCYHIVKIFD